MSETPHAESPATPNWGESLRQYWSILVCLIGLIMTVVYRDWNSEAQMKRLDEYGSSAFRKTTDEQAKVTRQILENLVEVRTTQQDMLRRLQRLEDRWVK